MIQGGWTGRRGQRGGEEGLARAGSGEECWRQGGWTGRRGRGGGYGNGEGVNGKLEMGVGRGGGRKGEGEKNGKLRGDFIDGYDGMPGWT